MFYNVKKVPFWLEPEKPLAPAPNSASAQQIQHVIP